MFLLLPQPEELTLTVEFSNIIFSAIFAIEMLLKIIAEGPFNYIGNGFNVFDGVIVILRYIKTISLYSCLMVGVDDRLIDGLSLFFSVSFISVWWSSSKGFWTARAGRRAAVPACPSFEHSGFLGS